MKYYIKILSRNAAPCGVMRTNTKQQKLTKRSRRAFSRVIPNVLSEKII